MSFEYDEDINTAVSRLDEYYKYGRTQLVKDMMEFVGWFFIILLTELAEINTIWVVFSAGSLEPDKGEKSQVEDHARERW